MPIDFDQLLTVEQRRDLLTQRLLQFAAEAYQHELNRQIAESANDTQGIEQSEAALAILETAITVHEEQLNGLP